MIEVEPGTVVGIEDYYQLREALDFIAACTRNQKRGLNATEVRMLHAVANDPVVHQVARDKFPEAPATGIRVADRAPGPPVPPLVPGHFGTPTYKECAQMLFVVGLAETTGTGLPPAGAFKVGPWDRRLREWGRREVERGNLDNLIAAITTKDTP